MLTRLLFVLLLFTNIVCSGADLSTVEEGRIAYLISAVETLKEAQFIRNGVAYDGKAAADHQRMKRQKAGARIRSAEDFIGQCASVSGNPYLIRFKDGQTVQAADYLRQKLTELRRL